MPAASHLTWTDLLTRAIEETYPVADNLMSMVADDELDWKPATGQNWMTTGQLLMHITNACGLCCQGFVTGDWGMPEGVSYEDIPPEETLPEAETMPTVQSVAEARRLIAPDLHITRVVSGQNKASPIFSLYARGDTTRAGRRPRCSWPAWGSNSSQTMSPRSGT